MKLSMLLLPVIVLSLAGCSSEDETSSSSLPTPEEIYEMEHGIKPVFNAEDLSVTYGLYPQTVVLDEEILNKLNALGESDKTSYGWYSFEGDYYTKAIANPKNDQQHFSTYDPIEAGKEYWYKCEPIKWFILSHDTSSDEYLLLASCTLDAMPYCPMYDQYAEQDLDRPGEDALVTVYPNNYKYSHIRRFLINDFYKSAFALHNECVLTTHVDNSGKTTQFDENPYVCDDTDDKVFLLSYQDYLNNHEYGFNDSRGFDNYYPYDPTTHSRIGKLTDYSTAKSKQLTYNNCTRSPETDGICLVWGINESGHMYICYTTATPFGYHRENYFANEWGFGVRPAITFRF